jgi:hypothetical protein
MTWVFIDPIQGKYAQGKHERRPIYLNEAFWPSHQSADNFR